MAIKDKNDPSAYRIKWNRKKRNTTRNVKRKKKFPTGASYDKWGTLAPSWWNYIGLCTNCGFLFRSKDTLDLSTYYCGVRTCDGRVFVLPEQNPHGVGKALYPMTPEQRLAWLKLQRLGEQLINDKSEI